jgi:hypothetical protein
MRGRGSRVEEKKAERLPSTDNDKELAILKAREVMNRSQEHFNTLKRSKLAGHSNSVDENSA